MVVDESTASPSPHIRRAHWHSYWMGPRQEGHPDRKPVLKWLPPIPVAMDKGDIVPTIHSVE